MLYFNKMVYINRLKYYLWLPLVVLMFLCSCRPAVIENSQGLQTEKEGGIFTPYGLPAPAKVLQNQNISRYP